MGRIFGTDGARGIAGTVLSAELAQDIGRAAALVLTKEKPCGSRSRVIIGKDPRISSDMLEAAVAAGLCSVGVDVVLVGVLPTPAVAYLVRHLGADAGVMISASHNPAEYNGIKLFGADGRKLADELEEQIEAAILDDEQGGNIKQGADIGRITRNDTARDAYISFVAGLIDADFSGMRLLIDCANGAASTTAGELFGRAGVQFSLVSCEPDGLNINRDCGSTHIAALGEKVRAGGYHLGLAFDGDADRLLAVDSSGEVISGDVIMAIIGSHLKERGRLRQDTIVVTTMTNMGFFDFAKQAGIQTAVTRVGDRYVLERMTEEGYSFGGEQSGHFICLDHHTTGDGQLSAILLLDALAARGAALSELKGIMSIYPQILLGVPATPEMKAALSSDVGVAEAIANAEALLGSNGRVDVRPSGTEPLIRVMVEGKEQAVINEVGRTLARIIEERLKQA